MAEENKKREPLWKRLAWTAGIVLAAGTTAGLISGLAPVLAVASAVGFLAGLSIVASPFIAIEMIANHRDDAAAKSSAPAAGVNIAATKPENSQKPSTMAQRKALGKEFKGAHDAGIPGTLTPSAPEIAATTAPADAPARRASTMAKSDPRPGR